MPHDDLIALLRRARAVLERCMFEADGAAIRDEARLRITALEDSELVLVDAA